MYKIFVGEISPARKENWFHNDENPYAVWAGEAIVTKICSLGTLSVARNMLREEVDVDWGSSAWKGNKQEILAFFEACKFNAAPLEVLQDNTDYAVVFLETIWGDSA